MIKTRFEAPSSLTLYPLSLLGRVPYPSQSVPESTQTYTFKAGKRGHANKNHAGPKGVLVEHCDIRVPIIIGNTGALRKYITMVHYSAPMFLKLV